MQEARATIERIDTLQMDIIRVKAEGECEYRNHCQWLQCALQVLTNNPVHPIVFAEALLDLMKNGGGKIRNIFVAGPGKCAKTFPLSPLQNVFEILNNPCSCKYAWLGVE